MRSCQLFRSIIRCPYHATNQRLSVRAFPIDLHNASGLRLLARLGILVSVHLDSNWHQWPCRSACHARWRRRCMPSAGAPEPRLRADHADHGRRPNVPGHKEDQCWHKWQLQRMYVGFGPHFVSILHLYACLCNTLVSDGDLGTWVPPPKSNNNAVPGEFQTIVGCNDCTTPGGALTQPAFLQVRAGHTCWYTALLQNHSHNCVRGT